MLFSHENHLLGEEESSIHFFISKTMLTWELNISILQTPLEVPVSGTLDGLGHASVGYLPGSVQSVNN